MRPEISNVPEGWARTSLGEVCEILDHRRIPVNHRERDRRIEGKQDQDLFPYYGATGNVGVIDDYIFEGEHILLGEDGAPFLDPIKNKAYLVQGRFWVNNHAHILKSMISSKYLCHYLNTVDYSPHVTGTTRHKLTQRSLKDIFVSIPGIVEQYRIVAKIEELFSELDAGIESLKKARTQLTTYRQAVLKHAFEGKLTVQWREEHKDSLETREQVLAHIKQERESRLEQQLRNWRNDVVLWEEAGKVGRRPSKPGPVNAPSLLPESEADRFATLPVGWAYVSLGLLIDGPKYGTSKKCGYNHSGTGVLRIPNVVDGVINTDDLKGARFDEDELRAFSLVQGDVLMIRSNGSISIVGKSAIVSEAEEEYLYAGYLMRLRSNRDVIIPMYLGLVIGSQFVRVQIEEKAKSTSGVNNINAREVQSLVVPICDVDEQQLAANKLEIGLSVIDDLDREINDQLSEAEVLRQAIRARAFSGQLVLQDPNDEPASVLLDRIRAEREQATKSTTRRKKAKVTA